MNKIKTENWNNHEIRFIEVNPGDWWAVAVDIAEALGYERAHNMVRMIAAKGTHKVSTLGGDQWVLTLSEFGIYDAIFNSRKPEAKAFKKWTFEILKSLRQASGLEAFQVFRMLDKEHQVKQMAELNLKLRKPVRVDFIKCNTVANKAISSIYGYPKMLKKGDMSPEMLLDRQPILEDTVNLMTANDSFCLGVSVSQRVYEKYC